MESPRKRVPGWRPGSQVLTEAALPGLLATQPLTARHVGASQLLGDFTGPGQEGTATRVQEKAEVPGS